MRIDDAAPTRLARSRCGECDQEFFYDVQLWDEVEPPSFCDQHYRRRPQNNSASVQTGRFQRVDDRPRKVVSIVPALVQSLVYECGQRYIVFGKPNTGKAIDLPLGLIASPEISSRGVVAVVHQERFRTKKWAETFGSRFYGSESNTAGNPVPPCGPYFVVGYEYKDENRSGIRNLVIYMTDGMLLKKIASEDIVDFSVIVLNDRDEYPEHFSDLVKSTNTALRKYSSLRLLVISERHDQEADDLFRLVGDDAKVFHIPA